MKHVAIRGEHRSMFALDDCGPRRFAIAWMENFQECATRSDTAWQRRILASIALAYCTGDIIPCVVPHK